ncbi:hypothetical protein DPMN_044212 [Dreissena polymorpha]|uniref:Pappalysin-1 SD scarf domain-containing protein n=1 Tax=Dreissena polymorpha TaxID=45954 RepID=A0A9D4HYI6_DREPO|nr:hypothetical protein DPMN_044212 [Dreissena polymorpha]
MLYGKKEEEQWVSGVIGYSSQYGSDNFSAEAILGVPDMYPTYGKAIAAWAPDVIDENQFLEFQFATPVYVTKVDVYEVYKAGGVKAIKCFDVSEAWITLWSTKQVSVFESARIFSPSFTSERPCFSNHIRLDIDCTVANTWVQIDAVRLHGSKEAVQWANAVIGYSSEYGSDKWSAKQTLGLPDVYPRYADDKKAWAPDVIDAHQYLLLQFATPVYVTQVDVYETFNAGGVKEIVCYDYQENVQRRIRLWSTDKVSAVKSARVFSPSFENNIDIGDCFSNEILLIIDCTAANTWVEIDAVRLKGYQKPWSRLAKREHVNEVLEDEEDKAVTAVESAAAKMSIKQLLAHVRK